MNNDFSECLSHCATSTSSDSGPWQICPFPGIPLGYRLSPALCVSYHSRHRVAKHQNVSTKQEETGSMRACFIESVHMAPQAGIFYADRKIKLGNNGKVD